MEEWRVWLQENWFNLVQTTGIVGGILFAAVTTRRDRRTRRVGDLLTLAQHHRDLWSEVHRRAELRRVLLKDDKINLIDDPISDAEFEFLNLVIVHFYTGWLLARENGLLTNDVLAADARDFFSLPLPHRVWLETRSNRDPKFVTFIEQKPRERTGG